MHIIKLCNLHYAICGAKVQQNMHICKQSEHYFQKNTISEENRMGMIPPNSKHGLARKHEISV